MTRVCILKSALTHLGGAEKYTLRLARAFAEADCSVDVLTTGAVPKTYGNITVTSLGPQRKPSLRHLVDFDRWSAQWIGQNAWDVVFGMDRNRFQTHYRAGSGVHRRYLDERAKDARFWKRLSFKLNPLHRTICRLEKKILRRPGFALPFHQFSHGAPRDSEIL